MTHRARLRDRAALALLVFLLAALVGAVVTLALTPTAVRGGQLTTEPDTGFVVIAIARSCRPQPGWVRMSYKGHAYPDSLAIIATDCGGRYRRFRDSIDQLWHGPTGRVGAGL